MASQKGAAFKYNIKLSDLLESNEKIAVKDRKIATERIGKRALELIKADMNRSLSPITGQAYKHKKTGGGSKLKESGSLHASIKDEAKALSSELTIRDNTDRLKAENHNKRGPNGEDIGRAVATKVPRREFFPTKGHGLRKGILKKLRKEIEDLMVEK